MTWLARLGLVVLAGALLVSAVVVAVAPRIWSVANAHDELPLTLPSFVDGSLLCQGSIVSGSHVERSIISPGVFIDHDAHVTDCIIMEGVHIGAGARLKRCIIDKNVVVPDWYRIGLDREEDGSKFTLSDSGVVVVEKGRHLGR